MNANFILEKGLLGQSLGIAEHDLRLKKTAYGRFCHSYAMIFKCWYETKDTCQVIKNS
jgi:hypothetical protein